MHMSSILKAQKIDFFSECLLNLKNKLFNLSTMSIEQILEQFTSSYQSMDLLTRTKRQIILQQIFFPEKVSKNELNTEK